LHEHTGWVLAATSGSGFDQKWFSFLCLHDGRLMRLVDAAGALMPTEDILEPDEARVAFSGFSVTRRFGGRIEDAVQALAFPEGQRLLSGAGTVYEMRGRSLVVVDVGPDDGPFADLRPLIGHEVPYAFAKGLRPAPASTVELFRIGRISHGG
jgi:hypothetical protein